MHKVIWKRLVKFLWLTCLILLVIFDRPVLSEKYFKFSSNSRSMMWGFLSEQVNNF